MGEAACYLDLLDSKGQLSDSPVLLWPIDSDLPVPPGLKVMIGPAEPPSDLQALRLPELANADPAQLASSAYASRVQLLVNAAMERRVVLLHSPEGHQIAAALAQLIEERMATARH